MSRLNLLASRHVRRFLLPLPAAVLLAACSGSTPGSNAGMPTPADAGIDAGWFAGNDGGFVLSSDAGMPAPHPVVLLTVAPNPNNVVSAVATVSWTGDISSVRVLYQMSGMPYASTPSYEVDSSANSAVLPVLGIKASEIYYLVAVGTDSAGSQFASAPVSFKTGPLPPDLQLYDVSTEGSGSPGYTLVALMGEGPQAASYLTIVDEDGAPVWYLNDPSHWHGDFQKQPDHTYTFAVNAPVNPGPVLPPSAVSYRQVDVLGNPIRTWGPKDFKDPVTGGLVHVAAVDAHELRIEPNGDALLFGVLEKTMNLSAQGGRPNAAVVGDVLERVTPGGQVAFVWNAFDDLSTRNIDPVAASVRGPTVDFTHANAIEVTNDGNYLVSLRNLSQVVKVDAVTGDILWKLGGKDGDFTFLNDPLGGFSCQHGVRMLPNGDITLFDDGNGHQPPQSRGVEYALDMDAMTATLVWSAEDDPPQFTSVLGFVQRLTNGNTLIDFGVTADVQEFDPDGDVVWDLDDPAPSYGIYRAFRLDTLY